MRIWWILLAAAPAFAQYSAPAPIFSKLFGGSAGTDVATGLAVDPNGDVAVVGTTDSPDFPVTGAAQPSLPNPPLLAVASSGISNPPIGAVNITAFAASSDDSVIYAASVSGVYRSADQGATWTRQSSSLTDAVALAVDGSNSNVVYASYSILDSPGAVNGILKSTDAGTTWTPVIFLSAGIVHAPAQLSGVLYSVSGGVFRSNDGGTTWSGDLTPHNYNIFAMALAPSDPNAVYIVVSDGNLYKSSDGGNTWTAPGGSFAAYPNANASLYITNLAVDSQNENIVWALNHAGTLWRSTDGGATFSVAQQTGNNPQGPVYFSISGNTIIAGQMLSFDGGNTWSALPEIAYETAALATPGAILIGTDGGNQSFLTKWSSDGGTMLFSTSLPSSPSGRGPLVASDSSGDTWVASSTLLKFDHSGKQLASQSLNGLNPAAMALDPSGNVYVAAYYYNVSTGNCTTPASQNGSIPVLLKFSSQGSLVYSNPLTQLCFGNVYGMAADASGNVYLAGSTGAISLPVTPTALQPEGPFTFESGSGGAGFFAILSPSGANLTYLSYLGGANSTAEAVTLDASRNIYVAGTSTDALFPLTLTFAGRACSQTQDGGSFAFVVKFNPSSATPVWVDELGGQCVDSSTGTQIALDSAGDVWVGGTTSSGFFPTLAPFELQGEDQGFLSEVSPDGEKLLFSSYAPGAFALGPGNTLYVAGGESPTPPKVSPFSPGLATPTSAFLEAFNLSGSQASVIDSIPSLSVLEW